MYKSRTNVFYFLCLTFLTIVNVSHSHQITNCEFVEYNIYHVRLSCEDFSGTHEPFECFHAYFKNKYLKDKVQTVETGNCRGNRLNSSLPDFFRSLHEYNIFYYGVEYLSASELNFRSLKKLNASHNELSSILGSTFDKTPNLAEIDFSFNKIMALEKDAFSRLGELQILDLKSNFIELIDKNMFDRNKKLKQLNLAENPLKRFDGNIFWPLLNSCSVQISCDHLKELDTSCLEESLKIEFLKKSIIFRTSENSSKLTLPEESFKNLTYFNISGNRLQNASKFVEILGPSIETLDLSSNFVGTPRSKIFKFMKIIEYFGNLAHLSLSNMHLTNVTFNATESKLKVLELYGNQLSSLSFDGKFEYLEKFDASHNNLIEIQPSIFNSIPNVADINLSYNKISTFASETFSNLEHLQILDLSNNLIQLIDGKLFENDKELKKLQLENNSITRIDCNMFDLFSLQEDTKKQTNEGNVGNFEDNWRNLIEIDLSCMKNSLAIDLNDKNGVIFRRDDNLGFRCSKKTLQNLKYLNISGLHLQNTPKLLEFLGSSLQTLDVSANFIGKINVQTFEKLTNLQVLQLSQTNLTNFGFETFYHHRKLHILDLSYNQLKKLNFTLLFRNFKYLNTLNLEGNCLTEVDTVTKLIFPNLTALAISKNHFSCDYLATFLFQWHNLRLIHNPSNQTNIDGVDCYHKVQGFDSQSNRPIKVTTDVPETTQTLSTTTDMEFISEKTEIESTINNDENNENENKTPTQTEIQKKTDNVNETKQHEIRNHSADMHNYYLFELRILEVVLGFCALCALIVIIKLKCMRIKGKLRCNPRERNRIDGRNGQHGIELIEHDILDE